MTRWTKVYRDLWNNRSRTILVILSIAVGVFAIGMIGATQQALDHIARLRNMPTCAPPMPSSRPSPMLDDDFVDSIRHMRGVDEAEGRRALPLRISLDGKGETWRDLTLYALHDYDDQRLFLVWQQDGNWPPEKGEVLLERASMAYLGVEPGDQILVKTPDGRKFHLTVTGRAHDLYRIPPVIEGWVYGYVSMDTIRWMGQAEGYNELYVDASGTTDAEIRAITDKVADRIEGEGLPVYQKTLPDRGEHPLNFIIDTVLILLGLLAALSMFLSGLLVVNVISALIAQQEKQIGIMKAIGARSWQIIGLYFGMVLLLGLIACLIAIPFSNLGANALAGFVAELINFDPPKVEYTLPALLTPVRGRVARSAHRRRAFHLERHESLPGARPERVWHQPGLARRGLDGCHPAPLPQIHPRHAACLAQSLPQARTAHPLAGHAHLCGCSLYGHRQPASFAQRLAQRDVRLLALRRLADGGWACPCRTAGERSAKPSPVWDRPKPGASPSGVTSAPTTRKATTCTCWLRPPAPSCSTRPSSKAAACAPVTPMPSWSALACLPTNRPCNSAVPMKIKIEGREQTYTMVGVMNMMGNSTIGYFTVMDYSAYARHVREPNRANAIILTLTPTRYRRPSVRSPAPSKSSTTAPTSKCSPTS